ncbi:MAG: glycosyltransferase family 9 protein [Bacillota bacterium]
MIFCVTEKPIEQSEKLKSQAIEAAKAGEWIMAGEFLVALDKLFPDNVDLQRDIAVCYANARNISAAARAYQRVLDMMPRNYLFLAEAARALLNNGFISDAMSAFRSAIALVKGSSDEAQLLWEYSVFLCLLGENVEGRKLYEARLDYEKAIQLCPKHLPQWQGENSHVKTLIIYHEQGMGDVIQFARFVPLVKKMFGGRIILVVKKPLVSLLKQLVKEDEIMELRAGVEFRNICRYDYAVAIMSLPFKMNVPFEDYSIDKYLAVGEEEICPEIATVVARLILIDKPKIGFCSSGRPTKQDTLWRDCPLEYSLKLIGKEGYCWVNLNMNLKERDFGPNVVNEIGLSQNFNDTAALVDACDLIITVDTAIAHLAGAMGKPVWLLLFYESEWRWGLNTDKSYWYPIMRIFRQPTPGDWDTPLEKVAEELEKYCFKLVNGNE